MIENYSSLFAFIVSVIAVATLAGFIFPKQVIETLRPQDALSGLRRIILAIVVVSIVSSVPSIFYQYFRTIGQEYESLRNISTVTAQVSKVANVVLLVLVYTYKVKEEGEK